MKIVLVGCLKELVWRCCCCCCWRVANVAGMLLAFLLQIWKRSSNSIQSEAPSSQPGKEATSFIKDLAKRRRASGVCGWFSVRFGSGDCCGPFIIIRLGLCFLNIRLLSTLSVLVVVVVVVLDQSRAKHLLDLPVAMAHFAFELDLPFAFIEDSTQCFGYLLEEWGIGLGDNPAINQSCLAAASLLPPMGILTRVQLLLLCPPQKNSHIIQSSILTNIYQ